MCTTGLPLQRLHAAQPPQTKHYKSISTHLLTSFYSQQQTSLQFLLTPSTSCIMSGTSVASLTSSQAMSYLSASRATTANKIRHVIYSAFLDLPPLPATSPCAHAASPLRILQSVRHFCSSVRVQLTEQRAVCTRSSHHKQNKTYQLVLLSCIVRTS